MSTLTTAITTTKRRHSHFSSRKPSVSSNNSSRANSPSNSSQNGVLNKPPTTDFCQVSVRIRPFTANEWNMGNTVPVWEGNENDSIVAYSSEWMEKNNKNQVDFQYDNVVIGSNNKELYERCVKNVVISSMEGFNGTVFAYGQTASGKTYSMMGNDTQPGIIPQAVDDVFYYIREMSKGDKEYLLRVSYMEIYNEQIQDLLAPETTNLRIFEDRRRGIYVSPLKEEIVTSPKQVMKIIQKGEANRHISTTDYNKHSSRSHTIFQMIIESKGQSSIKQNKGTYYSQKSTANNSVKISQLNLIDLSGSEKATSDADRRKEGAYINKSLLTLGNVISKLTDEKRGHIPYRDSKLTRILQSSLSGNAKISVICTISPAGVNSEESLNTLKFAKRVKRVVTKAHTNQVLDDKALIQKYKKEINELKVKLQMATDIGNMSSNSSLDEGKKDEELMLLQQERIKWEEEMHEQQLLRTALKERIDHLTKLILTSSSITPKAVLEFSHAPPNKPSDNSLSLLSPINISKNEMSPQLEEMIAKKNTQIEKIKKESKAKDDYIKELELMLQEGKYIDLLTPDGNEIENIQNDELDTKTKNLVKSLEKSNKVIEELKKKNTDLELLITQQDAKLSMYSDMNIQSKQDIDPLLSTPTSSNIISPEIESLLEDQQHSLELLEGENKRLRIALKKCESKLNKLELTQFETIENSLAKLLLDTNSNENNNNHSIKNEEDQNRKSITGHSIPMPITNISSSLPILEKNNNNSSLLKNSEKNISKSGEIKSENYYTMIIQELQLNLEKEKKKYQEESRNNKNKILMLERELNQMKGVHGPENETV